MITRRAKQKGGRHSQLGILFGGAVQDRCSENNCCLGLRGISNYTILKGESILPDEKVCDCIIFHDDAVPHIVIVELKRGLVRSGQVQEKFKNTLELVSKIREQVGGLADYRIVLLLLHGRGIPKSAHVDLRACTFKSRGRRHSLQILPCNAQLADLYMRTMPRGRGPGRDRRA